MGRLSRNFGDNLIRVAAIVGISWIFAASISVSFAESRSTLPTEKSGQANSSANSEGDAPPHQVIVPASVEAFFITDLYAKDSGYVSQINNDIGDHVKKGQVLARIEDPELKAQSEKANAAVEQAKASLELAKWQLSGMQADLNASEAAVAVKQANAELAKTTYKRWEGSPKGVVSDQEREEKKALLGTAVAELNEAQAKKLTANANVETAKAKVASGEADLDAAKAEAGRLKALLQYDIILAPFDGVVTRRLVNPGDLVQAATSNRGVPLFSLQELDKVRVFADVPEESAAAIHPGVPAEVKLVAEPSFTVRGTISRISGALDPATRTMRVEIDLPNPDEKLLPGAYAEVTLEPNVDPRHPMD
jgi:multidrug efflux pump subunit AcrA (membrane-fusion protein)